MSTTTIKRQAINPIKRLSQYGAAAVELAIVIVVLLLIVAGIIGFGRAFWYADALTKSTRDGARLLSTWPIETISSDGVAAARAITINSANAANVSPPLATGNVRVECLINSVVVVGCANGIAPAVIAPENVTVKITGFNVTLGEWFPFIGPDGVIDYGVRLSPHTTMRYMN